MATIKKKKETTIDELALEMREGFRRVDKTIEELARMVAEGFNSMGNRMDGFEKRMSGLEIGQDDIRNKLDNVAYRFELVELDKRVRVLEKKVK